MRGNFGCVESASFPLTILVATILGCVTVMESTVTATATLTLSENMAKSTREIP